MSIFQVDQCADSRDFVDSCASEGLAEIRRFPKRLRGSQDPDVLNAVLPRGHTLVTTDRHIHTEYPEHFPATHAGVVIVAISSETGTLTTRRMMRILAAFKRIFPDWHRVSLQNSVIEVTEDGVQVWRVAGGRMERSVYLEFRVADWSMSLVRALQQNAQVSVIGDNPSETSESCGG
jgi:hypothetical protein